MSKIKERILEPSIVYTGSSFKLKVKIHATEYHLYEDYIENQYSDIENLTYLEVREEIEDG